MAQPKAFVLINNTETGKKIAFTKENVLSLTGEKMRWFLTQPPFEIRKCLLNFRGRSVEDDDVLATVGVTLGDQIEMTPLAAPADDAENHIADKTETSPEKAGAETAATAAAAAFTPSPPPRRSSAPSSGGGGGGGGHLGFAGAAHAVTANTRIHSNIKPGVIVQTDKGKRMRLVSEDVAGLSGQRIMSFLEQAAGLRPGSYQLSVKKTGDKISSGDLLGKFGVENSDIISCETADPEMIEKGEKIDLKTPEVSPSSSVYASMLAASQSRSLALSEDASSPLSLSGSLNSSALLPSPSKRLSLAPSMQVAVALSISTASPSASLRRDFIKIRNTSDSSILRLATTDLGSVTGARIHAFIVGAAKVAEGSFLLSFKGKKIGLDDEVVRDFGVECGDVLDFEPNPEYEENGKVYPPKPLLLSPDRDMRVLPLAPPREPTHEAETPTPAEEEKQEEEEEAQPAAVESDEEDEARKQQQERQLQSQRADFERAEGDSRSELKSDENSDFCFLTAEFETWKRRLLEREGEQAHQRLKEAQEKEESELKEDENEGEEEEEEEQSEEDAHEAADRARQQQQQQQQQESAQQSRREQEKQFYDRRVAAEKAYQQRRIKVVEEQSYERHMLQMKMQRETKALVARTKKSKSSNNNAPQDSSAAVQANPRQPAAAAEPVVVTYKHFEFLKLSADDRQQQQVDTSLSSAVPSLPALPAHVTRPHVAAVAKHHHHQQNLHSAADSSMTLFSGESSSSPSTTRAKPYAAPTRSSQLHLVPEDVKQPTQHLPHSPQSDHALMSFLARSRKKEDELAQRNWRRSLSPERVRVAAEQQHRHEVNRQLRRDKKKAEQQQQQQQQKKKRRNPSPQTARVFAAATGVYLHEQPQRSRSPLRIVSVFKPQRYPRPPPPKTWRDYGGSPQAAQLAQQQKVYRKSLAAELLGDDEEQLRRDAASDPETYRNVRNLLMGRDSKYLM